MPGAALIVARGISSPIRRRIDLRKPTLVRNKICIAKIGLTIDFVVSTHPKDYH